MTEATQPSIPVQLIPTVQLPARGAVRIGGRDRRAFLQGLVTNDLDKLTAQNMIYAALLTPQGKFQHDFFMTEQWDTIQLECEAATRAQDLAATLKKFKLRSNITIQTIDSIDVTQGPSGQYADPRHTALGFRTYAVNPSAAPFEKWDQYRIRLNIPDGSRDMMVGQSTLIECNLDKLNALSLDKGCYMGQELTARMHYRGLAKKHLYPITGPNLPPPGSDLRTSHALIGEMRSTCGNMGLALLKDDEKHKLADIGLTELVDTAPYPA